MEDGRDDMPTMAHVSVTKARKYIRSASQDENGIDYGSRISLKSADDESAYGSLNSKGTPSIGERPKRPARSWFRAYWDLVTSKNINVLLIFLPLAEASHYFGWGDTVTFTLAFLAMIPQAAMLGDLTEIVAGGLGDTAGGLMNASFGNAPEVVFSVQALRKNQVRVVQASLMGSILSNLLLVLGSAYFAGGLFSGKKQQRFNCTSAVANSSLLMMSALALFLPSHMAGYRDVTNAHVLLVSRASSCGMLLMYLQLMIFQFKTHAHIYEEDLDEEESEGGAEEEMSVGAAVVGLASITLLVARYSDFLVTTIDGFAAESQLSKTFVGVILIPIIGNVVEHMVAVVVAMRDKMELSMGIAVGSATQVSMFVIPSMVLLGWAMDVPLTLNFPKTELYIYLIVVLIVSHLVSSGSSNWMLGSMLITCYLMVALAFWFEKVLSYAIPDSG